MALSELRALPSDVRGPPVRLLLSGRLRRASRSTGLGGRSAVSAGLSMFAGEDLGAAVNCLNVLRALRLVFVMVRASLDI